MRSMKLNKIIEYLKTNEFYHDTFDLESDVEHILAEYNIFENLTTEERCLIKAELFKMAEQSEFSEVARLVHKQHLQPDIHFIHSSFVEDNNDFNEANINETLGGDC